MTPKSVARIRATGTYLPSKRLTNKDLESMVDTSDEWIVTRTGMKERRIAAEGEFASDMGVKAAKQALDASGIKPEDIDLIAVATSTPDYVFPNTAALIQVQLGCHNAVGYDFQAACTGYLYGLQFAKAMIESGIYKNILIIAAEKLSSFVDYTDRNTCILFGDGAAASVISHEGEGLAIDHVALGTDGSHAMLLTVPAGGCRQPASAETVAGNLHTIKMTGRDLFKQAVLRMTEAIKEALKQLDVEESQISWMVPHQANIRIIDAIAKRFSIPKDRTYLTVHKYGNTSASSGPIALKELMDEHKLENGDRIVLPAFGAGLTWGTAVVRKI